MEEKNHKISMRIYLSIDGSMYTETIHDMSKESADEVVEKFFKNLENSIKSKYHTF